MSSRQRAAPFPQTLDAAIDGFALCEVRRGVRLVAEAMDGIAVQCVLSGTLHARFDGRAEATVCAGSVLLLPKGVAISIAGCADPKTDVQVARGSLADRGGLPVFSPGGPTRGGLRLLIGQANAIAAMALGLDESLREPLVLDLNGAPDARALFAAMLDEVERPGLGAAMLASALMKLCLIHAARRTTPEPTAPRPGVSRVSGAVSAVLSDPGGPHSVASLAAVAHMSRSTFARHFVQLVGASPMEFVAKARIDHAAELLRSTSLPIKSVAAQCGFQNRSHFSRAFRRAHHTDPSRFRRESLRDALVCEVVAE